MSVRWNAPGWGPWVLDNTLELEHVITGYRVDLEWCLTSAHTLDWIYQIHAKPWADGRTVTGLIQAIHDVLDPQANLCSFSTHKTITESDVVHLVETFTSGSRARSLAVST